MNVYIYCNTVANTLYIFTFRVGDVTCRLYFIFILLFYYYYYLLFIIYFIENYINIHPQGVHHIKYKLFFKDPF